MLTSLRDLDSGDHHGEGGGGGALQAEIRTRDIPFSLLYQFSELEHQQLSSGVWDRE
jgi:hypothetical protein